MIDWYMSTQHIARQETVLQRRISTQDSHHVLCYGSSLSEYFQVDYLEWVKLGIIVYLQVEFQVE